MKMTFAVLALCAFAQGALAAAPDCRAIESTSGRLACYDAAHPPKMAKPAAVENDAATAKASDYKIVTFQRKPGRWRANVTPISQPATSRRGITILGFVTTEDSGSEESAGIAADQAIMALDS